MPKHNTIVINQTNGTIKIILTDDKNRNTSQIIEAHKNCCIPTIRGQVTVSVFPEEPNGNAFVTTPVAFYTHESDYNFMVRTDLLGRIDINRLRYGSTSMIQDGVHEPCCIFRIINAFRSEYRN